jgi:hypothetical protein
MPSVVQMIPFQPKQLWNQHLFRFHQNNHVSFSLDYLPLLQQVQAQHLTCFTDTG